MKGVPSRVFLGFFLFSSFSFFPIYTFSQNSVASLLRETSLIHNYHFKYAWYESVTDRVKAVLKGKAIVPEIFTWGPSNSQGPFMCYG